MATNNAKKQPFYWSGVFRADSSGSYSVVCEFPADCSGSYSVVCEFPAEESRLKINPYIMGFSCRFSCLLFSSF